MQTTGEDYYDIPEEWVPSANFAGRPRSEISDLSLLDIDNPWISIGVTSSSSEHNNENNNDNENNNGNDGPTPTALILDIFLVPQSEMPEITVTAPSRRQSLRQKIRGISDIAANMKRPSIRKKSDTAPPCAFGPSDYAPQLPRRAVSARMDRRESPKKNQSRLSTSESDLKARRLLGVADSGWYGEFLIPSSSFEDSEDTEEDEETELSQPPTSFSQKPRVREALERKQVTRLRMDFVGSEPKKFVDSPQSMQDTPLELYAIPERQPGRFRPTSPINGRRGSSTPASPEIPSPLLGPELRLINTFEGNQDLDDLERTRIYVPGSICLEKHPAFLRKDSVASLDPFAGEIDSIGRRPSDLIALEQVIVYFDDMGLIENATDECLDRYWLNGQHQAPLNTASSVIESEPLDRQSQESSTRSSLSSSVLSRFSFSSTSSGVPAPQETPQKRQLIRLRRLLSPGPPGVKSSEN